MSDYHKPSTAELEEYGKIWVDTMFDDLASLQGPGFSWKNFPITTSALACASLRMQYDASQQDEDQLKAIVQKLALAKTLHLRGE